MSAWVGRTILCGMWMLIVAGVVYVVYTQSVAIAVIVGALILYRAQRPSKLGDRVRDAWLRQQAEKVGADRDDVR